jgi:hypothetical protein
MKIRASCQHWFNAVHVFCRLARICSRARARALATKWEHLALYQILYR